MRCSSNINTNRMKVPPVQKKHRTRPVAQQEPRTQSQEEYLRTWTKNQVPGKITSLPLHMPTDEEILMKDLEFAMTCIGMLAMIGAIAGILALAAYWVSPWVVPAVISGTVLGGLVLKIKRQV